MILNARFADELTEAQKGKLYNFLKVTQLVSGPSKTHSELLFYIKISVINS